MKKVLLIIISILILLLIFIYIDYNDKPVDVTRSKVEYILDKYTTSEALDLGKKYYDTTIKIKRNDYFKIDKDDFGNYKYYSINNKDYLKVFNYEEILNIYNNDDIKLISEYYNVISYGNKYYIDKKKSTTNSNYIGSTISIKDFNSNKINYDVVNYYCDNFDYVGIVDNKPICNNLEEDNIIFSIKKYNTNIKVEDIKVVMDNKKIY